MKKRKKNNQFTIAIEVTNTDLVMVRTDSVDQNQECAIRTKTIRWRDKSLSLLSEIGIRELQAGFQALVNEEKLEGQTVRLVIGGEYCVARVIAGSAERIKHELDELSERSDHYIALGTGEKIIATHIRQIDARHQHAICIIANRKNVELIVETAIQSALTVELVEPSLVALSRCLGHMGDDDLKPVLILNLSKDALEIGISHKGNLILDYRPGGQHVKDSSSSSDPVKRVANHLARLQRYCERFYRFTTGELNQLFLCGNHEEVLDTHQNTIQNDRLNVSILDVNSIDSKFKFVDTKYNSSCCAALGSCLLEKQKEPRQFELNLLGALEKEEVIDLKKEIMKTCWPMIAAVLITAVLWVIQTLKGFEVGRLEEEITSLHHKESKVQSLKSNIRSKTEKIQHLKRVKNSLENPHLSNLLLRVAQCLPEGVWMKNINSTADTKIKIIGTSFSEDAIFETVRHFQKIPEFARVALQGTHAGQFHGAVVYDFELECELHKTIDNSPIKKAK